VIDFLTKHKKRKKTYDKCISRQTSNYNFETNNGSAKRFKKTKNGEEG